MSIVGRFVFTVVWHAIFDKSDDRAMTESINPASRLDSHGGPTTQLFTKDL